MILMHSSPENEREAIRQGLADLDAGSVQPLEEFHAEFCKRHGIVFDENLDGPQSSDS